MQIVHESKKLQVRANNDPVAFSCVFRIQKYA